MNKSELISAINAVTAALNAFTAPNTNCPSEKDECAKKLIELIKQL